MGSTCLEGKWSFGGFIASIALNDVFLTEMFSTHAWKVDNISIRTICCWKRFKFIVFLKK